MVDSELDLNHELEYGMSVPISAGNSMIDISSYPPLARAVLKTVAYVDTYDYPLSAAEVHRYLIGQKATESETNESLNNLSQKGGLLGCREGYYFQKGREAIVETRLQRKEIAELVWSRAAFYGNMMAKLPNVRMVSVTGSLAVDNADIDSDIDYLIVTRDKRLWTARAMIVLIVRLAAKRGIPLCPNYLVTERAIAFQERNLYTAREVAQMVPVSGWETYVRMREENKWVEELLPNSSGAPNASLANGNAKSTRGRWVKKGLELILKTPPGDLFEKWEMNRKIRKLTRSGSAEEAAFSSNWCKGHFESHGRYALDNFDRRWRMLEGQDISDGGE